MAKVEELERLVQKLAEENAKLSQHLKDSNAAQKAEIDRVIAALGRGGGGGVHGGGGPVPDPAAARAKNIANLKLSFRKSSKVKDFKESQELKV